MRGKASFASRLLCVIFLLIFSRTAAAGGVIYGGGTGEPNDPYLIYTAEQMNAIGLHENDWNKHFRLMADIDLGDYAGTDFNIIGTASYKSFAGVFDGNGYIISNLNWIASGTEDVGLFGYVRGENAQIKNLRLINPVIEADTDEAVGSLIGRFDSGTITACSVEGGFVSGIKRVGGMVGFNNTGSITECFSTATVSGTTGVGGLVGENFRKITNCYSAGSVSGSEKIGGLVGNAYNPNSITHCYSTAYVSGTKSVGGLVGTTNKAKWSFWDIETSGQTNSGGGTGKTTAEMQTASTFIGYWGSDPVWTIDEGADYPRLAWQNMPGELIIKPDYAEGSGTEADPYLIYTAEQLNMIGLFPCDWDKHFELMADVDLSEYTGTEFNIIGHRGGWSYPDDEPFTGVFDGNGREISNFNYSCTEWILHIGIFSYIKGATLENLYLIDPNINVESGIYVGSLVGRSESSISKCYVQGGTVLGQNNVGGLVGDNYGLVNECTSKTEVTGETHIGGIAGNNHGSITECISTAEVLGHDDIGGIVGLNGSGTISNCYSLGNVTGITSVGGLVGTCGSQGKIVNSYSAGSVQGTESAGGLVGLNDQGKILSCFWDIEKSGQSASAGGQGKTTAEIQTASTFIGWGPYAAWTINEGLEYPRLLWEDMPGEMLTTLSFPMLQGSGTQDDTYLIYTAEQLNEIGIFPLEWDKHYKLMADIDLSTYGGTAFNIIGHYNKPFSSVFDGNGHTISNLNSISGGIFYRVENGEIKNLVLVDPNVNTDERVSYVAALAGQLKNATVSNCSVEGGIVSGWYEVGGLIGKSYYGSTIRDCSVSGFVSGGNVVGGLVGANSSTITNCHFSGEVLATDQAGGLVGINSGTITNCHFNGEVLATDQAGGLAGQNYSKIEDCTVSANVSGAKQSGGLVGAQQGGMITGCYADGSVAGTDEVGGFIGGNNGTIANCGTSSEVTGQTYVGGFAGQNGWNSPGGSGRFAMYNVVHSGRISNCYAGGSVVGEESVGGFVGYNDSFGTIKNCYATGSVSGATEAGGLIGQNHNGDVIDSFWDIETSSQTISAAGAGKTTTQMQEMSTFVVWACDAVWTIDEGSDYPRLAWEEMPGVPIAKTSYGGGNGIETDPYLIYTAEQLNEIGLFTCDYDKHFKLMADIDLSAYLGTDFNIIGFYAGNHNYNNCPFTGIFDGNGHTISNFTYVSTEKDRIGLFMYLDDPNAQIKNLGLIDPNINAGPGYHAGSLVGVVESGSIVSCFVEGGHVSGDRYVGGLAGSCYGDIHNCYYSGTVTGNHCVGGLVGRFSSDGTISDSDTTVTVTGSWAVGGLVGENYGRKITNCRTAGTVAGDGRVGGLVGNNSEGEISDCNSAASVQGGDCVGGFAGASWGTIIQCCATGSVSGNRDLGGLVGYNCCPLTKCYAKGSVIGNNDAGGLVGSNMDTISACYSTGSVSGVTNCVGGLVGHNSWDGAAIYNSYATENVVGTNYVGGLAGYNSNIISKCYSTGEVSGIDDIGGLVGDNSRGSIIVCFWDMETSGLANSDGGFDKTTAEMRTAGTFLDAGWDFAGETANGTEDIWWILEGQDYPRLWWEPADEDILSGENMLRLRGP